MVMTTTSAPLRTGILVSLLTVVLGLSMAQGSHAPTHLNALADEAAPSTLADIEKLIGGAACQRDSDCRVIGVGARACGGPEGYRAWSATQTDGAALAALVHSHAQVRRLELERRGELSTCDVKPTPGVRCALSEGGGGRCVLVPGTGSGAV
jgi:hypothetical protein